MARGQFGARHFEKYAWYLPVPEFEPTIKTHDALTDLAARAEDIAADARWSRRAASCRP